MSTQHAFEEASDLLSKVLTDSNIFSQLDELAALIAEKFQNGGKVLVAGNGGSMADANHFAEELAGKFRKERPALFALALSEPSLITCIANDFGYNTIFSRCIQAYGNSNDILFLLTTSGNSQNLIRAGRQAKKMGLYVAALSGRGGGKLKSYCDFHVEFPGETSDRIQELQMLALHALVQEIEKVMGFN